MKTVRFKLSLWLLPLWLASTLSYAATYPQPTNDKNALVLELLELAIEKSGSNIKLEPITESLTSTRAVEEVISGGLDIYWAGTRQDYEEKMQAIYVPIFKGLLGHRIFIIEQGKQPLFDNINSLADLKRLKAGQGKTWGDTQALLASGIPTVTTLKFPNLFYMLEGDRFDYFPRAVHEPWSEIERFKELNLTVEKRILLIYPLAMYFFVAKENKELYKAINDGLEKAIADGSFDKVFYSSPLIKDALAKTNIKERLVIRIPNPGMSQRTPFDRKELWLDLEQ